MTFRSGLVLGIGLSLAVVLVMGAARISDVPDKTAEQPQSAEPFIGEVMLFAGNFSPRGWGTCDGRLLSISSNNALFSILGTSYGGDGRNTFALPNLQGRSPLSETRGYPLGRMAGNLFQVLPAASGGKIQVTTNASDRAPYLSMNYCIALEGTYPSRN